MEYLNNTDEKVYTELCNYNQYFSCEELIEFENKIFGSLSNTQRVVKEFSRLKNLLMQNSNLYAKYINEVVDIESKLKIVEFDPAVLNGIALKIVNLQMKLGMDVRLLSTFPKLQKEYEYNIFAKQYRKEKNK